MKFAGLFAVRLRIEKPEVALNAWRTPTGRLKGLAAGVSEWSAKRETAFIVAWLDQHLEAIFSSIITDDPYLDILDYFRGEAKHFRSLAARWPSNMRAQYSRLPHSDGVTCCWPRRIAIFPAQAEGEPRQIRCDGCGHVWTEDEYAAEATAYEHAERARRRPNRVKKAPRREVPGRRRVTPGRSLTDQYFDIASLFGRRTATNALAEWLTRVDRPPLGEVSAVVHSPQRIHASELTEEHIGRSVSFRRAGAITAHARVAGYLSEIRTGTRANGMPGKTLVIG